MRHAAAAIVVLAYATCMLARGQSPPTVRPPATRPCAVHTAQPSPAETALAREEYIAALDLYGSMLPDDPSESRAGTIRTMLGQDRIKEAHTLADAWTAEQPANAIAWETLAEVQFRAGELTTAYKTNGKAIALDHCLGRSALLSAAYEDYAGYFAMGRRHLQTAHLLSPHDVEIREAWIETLPAKRRLEERKALVADESLMNAKDRVRMQEYIDHAGNYKSNDCRLAAPVDNARVAMQPIMDGPNRMSALALDVQFNGKRRRLEIDTGASGLLLSRSAASSLGLMREQKVASGGIGDKGEVAASIAHVASVKIGTLEFLDCRVEILEKGSALDIDGLIGGNVFSKFLLTLDYPKRELRLDPLPRRPDENLPAAALSTPEAKPQEPGAEGAEPEEEPARDRYIAPEMKDWFPVFRSGHDLLMPVRVGEGPHVQTTEKLFIVDTGASSMLISPAAAREITKVARDESIGIRGISGDVEKVYQTSEFTYSFANIKQKVYGMTSIDTTKISHGTGVEVSGFLGAPVLFRLTVRIDYRDNLMLFVYDPKTDPYRY